MTGLAWWATGVDVFYGVVVATTALGPLAGERVTAGKALKHLGIAAGLAAAGVLAFGEHGVGLSTEQRLLQGTGGVLMAAMVLVAMAVFQRHAARRDAEGTP